GPLTSSAGKATGQPAGVAATSVQAPAFDEAGISTVAVIEGHMEAKALNYGNDPLTFIERDREDSEPSDTEDIPVKAKTLSLANIQMADASQLEFREELLDFIDDSSTTGTDDKYVSAGHTLPSPGAIHFFHAGRRLRAPFPVVFKPRSLYRRPPLPTPYQQSHSESPIFIPLHSSVPTYLVCFNSPTPTQLTPVPQACKRPIDCNPDGDVGIYDEPAPHQSSASTSYKYTFLSTPPPPPTIPPVPYSRPPHSHSTSADRSLPLI
ncbi:hypothetical protein PTTG_10790, partial [Puccinia triticina 1-1 BBBD Race 1]